MGNVLVGAAGTSRGRVGQFRHSVEGPFSSTPTGFNRRVRVSRRVVLAKMTGFELRPPRSKKCAITPEAEADLGAITSDRVLFGARNPQNAARWARSSNAYRREDAMAPR